MNPITSKAFLAGVMALLTSREELPSASLPEPEYGAPTPPKGSKRYQKHPTKRYHEESKARRKMAARSRRINRKR
jgi:hypothetical protein